MTHPSRRDVLKSSATAAAAAAAAYLTGARGGSRAMAQQAPATTGPSTMPMPRTLAPGPFEPTWDSLKQHYKTPDWYRDAKFGIWAHWSAQCVPEQGDWYGRHMYLQGHPQYEYHVKTFGHPTKFGLMELQNAWKADKWEPERLMSLYKRAGAKYFFALANHHDNFDAYDSKHHAWNSVNVGPKKDIIGTWARVAREHGLRFGATNHASWASMWLQPAYGYDGEGPLAGARYDAYTLRKEDGRGKWWDGLDPQDLYTGNHVKIPDGITGAQAMRDWHGKNTNLGRHNPMPNDRFVQNWFLRCQDLVDRYQPDVLYFDTNELPLGQAGLDLVAHYYNASAARNGGRADVVVNGKHQRPEHAGAFVNDIERGVSGGLLPQPWQIDTCIGQWHYSRGIAERNEYKTVEQVACLLADVVSKNGNVMLSIPVRGDGTIDEKEEAFLGGMAAWIAVTGDAIFGTRPWKEFGEGPTRPTGRTQVAKYTPQDVRFTTKGGTLYAFLLAWPTDGTATVTSLAAGSDKIPGGKIERVELLGHPDPLQFTQDAQGLKVRLPERKPCEHAYALKINGQNLT